MQKVIPHLWFDGQALEAVELYTSLFEDSRILDIMTIIGTPTGDTQMVDFKLTNLTLSAIDGGPYFTFNSSISFMVSCSTKEEVDRLYEKLSPHGKELMPLGEYPFSKWYVWLEDQYGLGWQLMLVEDINEHVRIRPVLLFSDDVCGKAKEAMEYYSSVFNDSSIGFVNYYASGEASDERAKINYAEVNLGGIQWIFMDHGFGGDTSFNEAVSFIINCENQEEIDYFWDKLSFVPEAEICGWVKDNFHLSWQIVPSNFNDIYKHGTKEEIERVTKAFMSMKKFDLAELERARLGK